MSTAGGGLLRGGGQCAREYESRKVKAAERDGEELTLSHLSTNYQLESSERGV